MLRRCTQGFVLLALLLAGFAWVSLDKSVTVEVDGRPVAVKTYARSVADLLRQRRLVVGGHDVLAPAANAPLRDGGRVVLRRGRPVTLNINNRVRVVWVTALSVDEALTQVGVRSERAWTSASRSRSIPLSGLSLNVRTPAQVRLLVDGKAPVLTTTAATVGELLDQAGVNLAPPDRVTRPLDSYPMHRMTIRVVRVGEREISETVDVPYGVEKRPDPTMFRDQKRVVVAGRDGVRLRRYRVVYVDGKLTSRTLLSSVVTRKPVTRVLMVGTRRRTVDTLNWYALARCESHNNPRAVSSGGSYRGLYQFTIGTWRSVGGSGDPIDASRAEQTARAKKLYLRRGKAPWPVCGKYLFS